MQPSHIIYQQDAIIERIVHTLRPINGSQTVLALHLHATDSISLALVSDNEFISRLRTEFDNQLLTTFSAISIQVIEEAPPATATSLLDNSLFLYVVSTDSEPALSTFQQSARPAIHSLTFSALSPFGSIENDSVTLTPTAPATYHIGRGKLVATHGLPRINQIAIRTDDLDTEIQQRNNHVSSAHADIVYDGQQFYLRATTSGCRTTGGASTKIIHADETATELRDTHTLHPLQPSDTIELGKQVYICVKKTDENSIQ